MAHLGNLLLTLAFFAGVVLVVYGIALVYAPAALIVSGLAVAGGAAQLARTQ